MRGAAITFGAALLAGVAFLAEPFTGADRAKSRIIDRTLLCSTVLFAGVREVHVSAQAGVREFGSTTRWKSLAIASLWTGSGFSGSSIAGATAGAPKPEQGSSFWTYRDKCQPLSARIPLAAGPLSGGPASQFGDQYECAAPRRVLVRIRALFTRPARLRFSSRFRSDSTKVPVKEARIAVRTQTGQPLAYAEVFDSGKARLFTARSCVED